MSYRLTEDAVNDIEELLAYIARDGLSAAENVHTRLVTAFQRIGRNPALGHFREDLTPKPIRFWSVYSYLIVYRPDTKPVEIIRVLSNSRHIPALLE